MDRNISPMTNYLHQKSNKSISIINSTKTTNFTQYSKTIKNSLRTSNEIFSMSNEKLRNHYENYIPNKNHGFHKENEKKEIETLLKIDKLKEQEFFIQEYQKETNKKFKEIQRKEKEFFMKQSSIKRVLSETIVSSIINDII